jgi:integrase
MRDLNYDLKTLCQAQRQGSRATQAARFAILRLCADQLFEDGYRLPAAKSLKPKHVEALVKRWHREGLSAGTLKNRLAALRDWAGWVGKASIIPRDNEALGVPSRQNFRGNKAQGLDPDKLGKIECEYIKYALRLQAAFGLRREEALKFRPSVAMRGSDRSIALQGSWCKGGRAQEIPVVTADQRALLQEIADFVGRGSLIPEHRSYVQHLRAYEHECLNAGLRNPHGLRHAYAQARYQTLTGWAAPAAGGPDPGALTAAQRQADRDARLAVAEELGHGRPEIAATYLGGRG